MWFFDTDGAVDPSSWFTCCTINSSQRPWMMSLMSLLRDVPAGCTLLVQPPGMTTIVVLALASASLTWPGRWAWNDSNRTRQCQPFVWGIRTSLIHFRMTTWSIHDFTCNVIAMSPSLCLTFFKVFENDHGLQHLAASVIIPLCVCQIEAITQHRDEKGLSVWNIVYTVCDMDNFPKSFMKEYRGWRCTKIWAVEQQLMDLSCAGMYEADHYHSFMVYIWATSPHHVQCSKPFLVLSLLHEHWVQSSK